MSTAVQLKRSHEALSETAIRLVAALGRDGAIFVCRSNYWHGVLKLIESQATVSSAPA